MESRRTPEWILPAHLQDKCPELGVDFGSSAVGPGLPAPVRPEPLTMPTYQSLRVDNLHGIYRSGAKSIQPDEREAINPSHSDTLRRRTA